MIEQKLKKDLAEHSNLLNNVIAQANSIETCAAVIDVSKSWQTLAEDSQRRVDQLLKIFKVNNFQNLL